MTTVAETQLQIYNDALAFCEERKLNNLAEDRKPRRLLDDVWNGGGINACLEESDWIFGKRSIEATYDPSIQPDSGYIHAFKKPDDWLRTSAVSADPFFNSVFTNFNDEAGYWWCDLETLYLKIVSNDPQYGGNLALWPESFKIFVAAHFATKIVGQLTHDKKIKADVFEARRMTLITARGKDALNEPPGFFSRGQLSRARQGSYAGRPGWNRNGRY